MSYYRNYEQRLNVLLVQIKHSQEGKITEDQISKLFYEADFVEDLNEQLIQICDERLPRRWKLVTEQYRLVRAALQDL